MKTAKLPLHVTELPRWATCSPSVNDTSVGASSRRAALDVFYSCFSDDSGFWAFDVSLAADVIAEHMLRCRKGA